MKFEQQPECRRAGPGGAPQADRTASVKGQIRESERPCGIQWSEGSGEWGPLGAER